MNRRKILQALGLAPALPLLAKATASSATPWLVEREKDAPKVWIGIEDADGVERYHPRVSCLLARQMNVKFYNKDGPVWHDVAQATMFNSPDSSKPICMPTLFNKLVHRIERGDTLNVTININPTG